MKLIDFKNKFSTNLTSHYSKGETDQLYFILMEDKLGFSKTDLIIKVNQEIKDSDSHELEKALDELLKGKPIQYIVGNTWFDGLKIDVNQSVLIPRQETEELVDWIIKNNKFHSPIILDLCSGSGCISLALKNKIPNASVTGIDISEQAILLSKSNATKLNLAVKYFCKNILTESSENWRSDLIVSNPPYIRESERSLMSDLVLKNEPELALFVPDNDALLFYRVISHFAFLSLSEGGKLYFEINEALANETLAILEAEGFKNIELKKDLNNKYRMIKGTK